ncbi:gamma-interferon-inducible lysosomal thiol reductase-like [Olea europaea subsp. europaea]|uniref:Gamma-interferon-inducible lysosomal thiol reductase-like n=1 Tax=Olea europaea subsp. europaea TaxID=158383 RepID=A0A8S0T7S4_OLEEU|nr:gamma-interferon-inducible lysosomal thiol reductase-like [Olea europaea subsp. europaea]
MDQIPCISRAADHNPLIAMEPHRRLLSLKNRLLILLIISSLFVNPSSGRSIHGLGSEKEKVTLEIYYESLCPYCSNLIVNYLYKLFDTGIIAITQLKLIPYGNAKIRANGTITCQHGQYECLLNTVEACAIDVWPDLSEHFPFIYCIESLVYQGNYTQWETCFEKLGLDPNPVANCYSSGRGKELELGYAAETNNLKPPHRYVPWVVVDGQPLYDDYRNFISYICKAYHGTSVPSACSEYSVGGILASLLYRTNNLVKVISQNIGYNIM